VNDVFEHGLGLGGLGVAALAGAALLVGKGGRPVLKRAIKGGLVLGERARDAFAEATEQVQDLLAEAKAEVEAESQAGAGRPNVATTE
jgi:predicted hotdog family 3-hydroxylacyl-ACP dehydratase